VRTLLKQGADVDAAQPDGATALLWATYHNDAQMVDLLLAAGANVNTANTYGETPLSLACQNRNKQLVDEFLTVGADATAIKSTGETLLMTAARAGDSSIVKALIAYGASVNAAEPQEHQTALMSAAAHRHVEVADVLLAAGADVNAASRRGSTALHFAVQQADVPLARRLLAAGANLRARMSVRQIDGFTLGLVETLDGLSPLLLAITDCRRDGIEFYGSTQLRPMSLSCPALEELGALLLDRGADANDTDGSKIPALHQAVHAGMASLVKALIAHGADVNARIPASARQWTGPNRNGARTIAPMPVGATPFFLSTWWHNPEIMRILLSAGADARITIQDHTTPLMAAAGVSGRPPMGYSRRLDKSRMLEAVKLTIEQGNDVNAANDAGQTAAHGAAQLGSTELIHFLADSGARMDKADKSGRTPLSVAMTAHPETYKDVNKEVVDLLKKLSGSSQ
jgi:ankyrin repeat protein